MPRDDSLPFTKLSDEPLDDWMRKHPGPYIVEPKFDGEDLLVIRTDKGDFYAINRYGTKYREEDLPFLEIVIEWPFGIIVRGEMYIPGGTVYDLRKALKGNPAKIHFAVHDVLMDEVGDLRHKPLEYRKKVIHIVAKLSDRVKFLDQLGTAMTSSEIIHLYEQAIEQKFEGIVVKPLNSIYKNGACLKLKREETYDVLLTAVKDTGGLTKDQIPWSFRMECYIDVIKTHSGGRVLTYVGDVSSGLTLAQRAELWEKVKDGLGSYTWMNGELYYPLAKPLVAEVRCQELLRNGGVRMRHPTIIHIRDDKPPQECTMEP